MSTTRRALAALRWLRKRDTRRRLRGRTLGALVALSVALATALFWAAPDELAATEQGAVTHWGGWPLETAFTAMLLVAAVLTFRVVEVLFRTDGARALDLLPIPGAAFARDRFAVVLRDGVAAALVVSAAFAPLLLRPGAELVAATLVYIWAATWVCVAASFGTIAAAGAATADPTHTIAQSLDATGERAGAIFHFAPGVAFGLAGALLLFLKLGLEEPLRAAAAGRGYQLTRAFQVAVGIPLGVALLALISGLRGYAKHHHALQARFREADAVGAGRFAEREAAFDVASTDPVRIWRDAMVAQVARRHALLLPSSWVAGVVCLLVAWALRGQLSPVAPSAIACFWLVLVVHPARRLAGLASARAFSLAHATPGAHARVTGTNRSVRALFGQHAPAVAIPAVALGSVLHAGGHLVAIVVSVASYALVGGTSPTRRALAGAIAASAVLIPLALLGS